MRLFKRPVRAQVQRAAILKGDAGIGTTRKKDLTFDEARRKFEDWPKSDKKPNTVRSYSACLDYLSYEFSGKRLSEITPWSLEAYKKRRGEGRDLTECPTDISDKEWNRRCHVAKHGAPVRANRELAVLKTLYSKCLAWGLFEGKNPVCSVKFRKEPQTSNRVLEPAEEVRLLAAAREPLRSLILVGLHTGLRITAEALTMKWPCVDLNRNFLTVEAGYAKNGRMRSLPLNSIAVETLKALKAKATPTAEYVFAKKDGTPYKGIGTSFRSAVKRG